MTTIVLDPPCDLINANERLHRQAQAKLTKAWRAAAAGAALAQKTGTYDRAHITVTIRFPNNIRRDVGNYYPTAKAIVDGLVDAQTLTDDNDERVVGPDMRRDRPNGPVRVTIHIREEA